MTFIQNIVLRVRTFVGLILAAVFFLFGTKNMQIMVLDFLATRFANFRGRSPSE